MDSQTPPKPTTNYISNVDTSSPFRSVKEAVAVFGERILVGEMHSLKPAYSGSHASEASSTTTSYSKQEEGETSCKLSSLSPKSTTTRPNDNIFEEEDKNVILDALKKIKVELEETKVELKLLKEREQKTGQALALMNAELQKNMLRLAEAEAEAAEKHGILAGGKATKTFTGDAEKCMKEQEEKRRELMRRMGENTTLAQILSLGENDTYYGKKKERKMLKKKPIVPLVGDFIFRKKESPTDFLNSFYSSPQFYN